MNLCAFIDGYVQAALVINRTASTNPECPTACQCDYATGWKLTLKDARLFRCMRPDLVEMVASEGARIALALISSTVKGCERCQGKGVMLIACGAPEDYENEQCTCVDRALDEIETEIGS
jgi:hypothetical protein